MRPLISTLFIIFLQKDFTRIKSTKKHKKALKSLKALKVQRRNRLKEQNANKGKVKV